MRALLGLALVAACGGGGNPPADDVGDDTDTPVLVPGGGVTGAAIAGHVNVYVIAKDTGDPIAGAMVQAGDVAAAATDADGLVVVTDASLTGAVAITATAPGRAAATWFGVVGSSATIPLELATTPVAHVSGSISGWDSLPDPAFGNYNLAVVLYSLTDELGAPENHIAQPGGTTPANTCIKSAVSNMCAWQMNARVGHQIHFALIVEGDPHGTNSDPSDDTYELKGYAIGTAMDLSDNQTVSGENLTVVPDNQRTPITVTFPTATGSLSDMIAIPMLDLGDAGRLPFALPSITPGAPSSEVITATGQFAGTYDVVGLATPAGAATAPYSSAFARDTGASATLPAWMPTVSASAIGGQYAVMGADAAPLHYAVFTRGTTRLWTVSLLDGGSSFGVPAQLPGLLGTGVTTIDVSAAEVASFDPAHFAVPDVTDGLIRAAGASATFTP